MENLIGRKSQVEFLKTQDASNQAKFIAIGGRRRVGKTYLIRQVFSNSHYLYFEMIAKRKASATEQKRIFIKSYQETFPSVVKISHESSWGELLELLSIEAAKVSQKKFIIFIDELPWLAESDPSFLSELEHYWNSAWVKRDHLRLIICGSAASWMKEQIFGNTGGLFNRLTGRLEIPAFSVAECAEYLSSKKIRASFDDLFEYYLIFGGIPYYFSLIPQSIAPVDVIQKLLFSKNSPLSNEFSTLIEALFKGSKAYDKLLRILGRSRYGLNRLELSTSANISDGGTLERALNELVVCNFLTQYVPFGYQERGAYFRLSDEFLLFHITWLENLVRRGPVQDSNYYQKHFGTGKYYNWRGAAFEVYCQKNAPAILKALEISGMRTEISTWRTVKKSAKEKLQVDLVIDRADNIVTLVEIKSSRTPLSLSTAQLKEYQKRKSLFAEQTKTKKHVNSVLIAYADVINKPSALSVFDKVLTIEDLT